jgi:hypothetical protein
MRIAAPNMISEKSATTLQNILSTLATIRIKETKMENPSADLDE